MRVRGPKAKAIFPTIRTWWLRDRGKDNEFIKFRKPKLYLGLGQKEAGKSALSEAISIYYPKIIDLFGSRDNEGLSWCRSPFDSILFITGDSVDVKTSWNTVRISDVTLNDLRRHEVALTVSAFHPSPSAEFYGLNKVIETLYRRYHHTDTWCLMVREASNFLYSRLKVAPNQTLAKADFLYLAREARHMGYAMCIDTIRWTGVDADVRGVADYVLIKSLGIEGLPYNLRWLYRYLKPNSLMRVHPSVFAVVSRHGPVGLGKFTLPQWHKRQGEDMLKMFDLEPEYGDLINYGNEARNTVSDFEHKDIIVTYFEVGSMKTVAKKFNRSPATINAHIEEHDKAITEHGFCGKCRAVRGPHMRFASKTRRKAPVYDEIHSWEELQKAFAS